MEKVTVPGIQAAKNKRKLTMITAYDFPSAALVDEAGIDMVLVGDSVANTVLGYPSTIPVTMEEMLHHVKAVSRGLNRALLIADMPFLSYSADLLDSLRNAGRFLKEAGAEAVKLEGGQPRAEVIKLLVEHEIPVMGHIGLTPQSVHKFGGYKVQGKTERAIEKLVKDAQAIAEAGAFSLVLEGIPAQVAQLITAAIPIPTIGIGAGPDCDGQVLVLHDLLGISKTVPKFVKKYANLAETITQAVKTYCEEVRERRFPTSEHTYPLPEKVRIQDLSLPSKENEQQ